MRFDPGPAVGGHWIPLDPFYLAWAARQHDFHLRFSELAAEINILMPQFVREKVIRQLNMRAKPMLNAEILLIGMAYKKNVDDWQESPALKCLHLSEGDHAVVNYHEPRVPSFRDRNGRLRHSVPLTPEALAAADCVVSRTDHARTDWERIVRHGQATRATRKAAEVASAPVLKNRTCSAQGTVSTTARAASTPTGCIKQQTTPFANCERPAPSPDGEQ